MKYVLLHACRAGAKQQPASAAITSLARSAPDDCQEIMRDCHTLEAWLEVPSTKGRKSAVRSLFLAVLFLPREPLAIPAYLRVL